jgi:hypothetical protein
MFNASSTRPGDVPPLWIELFDHDAQMSLDSYICREIDDAVAAFDELRTDAETLNEVCRPGAGSVQV